MDNASFRKLALQGLLASTLAVPSSAQLTLQPSTVALWKFRSASGGAFPDEGPNKFHLQGAGPGATLAASPEDSALVLDGTHAGLTVAHDPRLNIGKTGKLTFEVKLYLDAYPSTTNHNQNGFVIGMYEGLGMIIRSDGRLQAAGQKGDGGSWMWYAPITRRDVVPLRKWVTLAVAADQASAQMYVYVDGTPVQTYSYYVEEGYMPPATYSGDLFRSPSGTFKVGNNDGDHQPLKGRIEAIRVSNALTLGAGLKQITTPDTSSGPATHFPIEPATKTVALWPFDGYYLAGSVVNAVNEKHSLQSSKPPLELSPFGRAAVCDGTTGFMAPNSPELTVGNTGKLTLEARIFMSQYPSEFLHNKASVILGMYEGLKLIIDSDGRIQAGLQRRADSAFEWFAPISKPRVVPTLRWVDVAVALDQGTKEVYAYVDGAQVQLQVPDPLDSYRIDGFRSPESPFTVCYDDVDGQHFKGLVDEVRVSGGLALGKGLPLIHNPRLWADTVPPDTTVPVKKAAKVNLGIKTHYAKAEDTLWVPVYLANFDTLRIASAQMHVHWDSTVAELLDVGFGSGLGAAWQLNGWNRVNGGELSVAMAGAPAPIGYGEGELLRFKLRVRAGVTEGKSSVLRLSGIKLDEAGLADPSHLTGRLVVGRPARIRGDVDGDDQVDLKDALRILEYVVGRYVPPASYLPGFLADSDVSGNGTVSSYDAALVFQYAVGLIQVFPADRANAPKAASPAVSAGFSVGLPALSGNGHRYRVSGRNLNELRAAEIAFAVGDPVDSITSVTSSLPTARVAWRYDAARRRLLVSLSVSDPVASTSVDFLEIEAAHAGNRSDGGLLMVSAYLNEGSLKGSSFISQPLSLADGPEPAGRAARLAFQGRDLVIALVPGRPASVALFDTRGRRIAGRDYTSAPGRFTLSRASLPKGLGWLRVEDAEGVRTAVIPNLGL